MIAPILHNNRPLKQDKNHFMGFKLDDILLIALILIILQSDDEDKFLLFALGYLFICEYIDLDNIGTKLSGLLGK